MRKLLHSFYYTISILAVGATTVTAQAVTTNAGTIALSTPELIQQAVQQGEIDAETRLLYLTQAIYDPQSLPAEYRSNVGWHGTEYVREIKTAYFNKPETLSFAVKRSMDGIFAQPELFAPAPKKFCDKANEANTDTTSARFAFSYGAIAGELTLTDYKDSMDNSANIILNSYGWAEPPLCTQDGSGGCTSNTNDLGDGDGRYPVLITNLGGGLYGYVDVNVTEGQSYNGVAGDNPKTTITETDSRASCMVINSDFTENNFSNSASREQQLNNLNGTTSHEYVHAVQNAWGDPGNQMDAMFAESTAAYFEDEVYDGANSANIYLYGDFNKGGLGPQGWQATQSSGDDMYRNFLLFRYIAESCGGANKAGTAEVIAGEDVIQRFFENVALGQTNGFLDNEFLSLKNAVESTCPGPVSFENLFHQWSITAKFMKDCQDNSDFGTEYCFDEATEYKATTGALYGENPPGPDTMVPAVTQSIASITDKYDGTIKDDYGLQWVRLPADGNADYPITLSRTSGSGILRSSVVCDNGSSFSVQSFQVVTSSPRSVTVKPTGCTDIVLVMTNEKESLTAGSSSSYTLQLGQSATRSFYVIPGINSGKTVICL